MLKTSVSINELFIKYIVEKLLNGYNVFVTKQEFLSFLSFFEKSTDTKVTGVFKKDEILEAFLRSESIYWDKSKFYLQGDVIYPTYQFVRSDVLTLNINLFGSEIGGYITNTILKFLESLPKRKLSSGSISETSKEMGEDISALLTYLAYSGVDNWALINNEMINFYQVLAFLIGSMYQMYPNLKISNSSMNYLAYANYLFLLNGLKPISPIFYADAENRRLTYQNGDDVGKQVHILTIHGEKNQRLVRNLNSLKNIS